MHAAIKQIEKSQHPYSQIEHEQQFAEWNAIVQYFSLHFYVRQWFYTPIFR